MAIPAETPDTGHGLRSASSDPRIKKQPRKPSSDRAEGGVEADADGINGATKNVVGFQDLKRPSCSNQPLVWIYKQCKGGQAK